MTGFADSMVFRGLAGSTYASREIDENT